jgi:hypothetical protein
MALNTRETKRKKSLLKFKIIIKIKNERFYFVKRKKNFELEKIFLFFIVNKNFLNFFHVNK